MVSLKFGTFNVDKQVFLRSKHSFAIVNLKPIIPGHVLICSKRAVKKWIELSSDEVCCMFTTAQKVQRLIQKVYDAPDATVSIQDGPAAGQTIPHTHIHIVPRRPRDLPFNDDIYVLLDKFELQLSELQLKSQSKHDISSIDQLNSSNTVQSAKNLEIQCDAPDEQRINATELDPAENETESGKSDRRVPRSQDAMAREAQFLRKRLFELGYEGLGLGKKEK